ncbi:MAG TPA: hypothetical protein VGG44_03730 [Tepidisphaeraceae bacterium]|jgi:hypothetical protein
MNPRAAHWMESIDRYALPVGIVSLVICALAGIWPAERNQFFNAYLFGWLFWLGISLGCLTLSMLHYLTGGGWGVLIRPITLSAARVLPLLFILFLPIFLGMTILFPWARSEELARDPILRHDHAFLNAPLFFIRYLIYFAVWIGLTFGLTHAKSEGIRRRISAGGLIAYVVLISLAGVDWIMSREPHWSSSVFGFILSMAQSLTGLCFAIVILWSRAEIPSIAKFAKPKHFIDLGNLLLMFIILWAYMNFAQFLVTWTGNEQPDIAWYVQRTYGGWRFVAGIIIFIHFLLTFFILLSRAMKRDINRLGLICAILLLLRVLDAYWNIGPLENNDPHGGFVLSPLDVLAWLGIGGLWYATFSRILKTAPLLALSTDEEGSTYGESEPQSV